MAIDSFMDLSMGEPHFGQSMVSYRMLSKLKLAFIEYVSTRS
jgi:hypothetical protein